MIDIHSHLLPGLDDGASSVEVSVEMARIAVADGIVQMACTPHIVPGLYENSTANIAAAVEQLRGVLASAGVPLALSVGADVHVAPDLLDKLQHGSVPTLNGSRYFLLEPPHRVLPPRLLEFAERLIGAGFVPILTHPERLHWIQSSYDVVQSLNHIGCLMQVTAGSFLGDFGKLPLYYSEKLLDEGRIDILASDAHGIGTRRPTLARARDLVAARVGEQEARAMVEARPYAVLSDQVLAPVGQFRVIPAQRRARRNIFARILGRTGS